MLTQQQNEAVLLLGGQVDLISSHFVMQKNSEVVFPLHSGSTKLGHFFLTLLNGPKTTTLTTFMNISCIHVSNPQRTRSLGICNTAVYSENSFCY